MTSPVSTTSFAAACALALAGCGGGGAPAAGPASAEAVARVAAYVSENRPRLPWRASSRQTIAGLRADGGELVVALQLSRDMPADMAPDAIARHNEALDRRTACRDPQLGEIIRLGGTIRHEVSTPNGTTFQTRVTGCPRG